MVPIALGGDFGGSIRIPAAFNGIYGLKTTEGSIGTGAREFPGEPGTPRYRRMMVAGPLARTAADLDLAWNALIAKRPDHKVRMLKPKARLEDYTVAYFDEWNFRNDKITIGQEVKTTLSTLAATLYLGVGEAPEHPHRKVFHAWLRCGDILVTGGADASRYQVLASFYREL